MQNITVKNISSRLHKTLKHRAQITHRSLNSEIIASLEAAVGLAPLDQNQMAFDAALFRDAFKGDVTPEEIDRLKKEGRA